jgi:DNA-binding transcriptional MerR regulator
VADARDRLVTTTEAAHAANVAPSTVRKWASRGLLNRYANDELGRPLYLEADVLDVERATRRKGRRRATFTGAA